MSIGEGKSWLLALLGLVAGAIQAAPEVLFVEADADAGFHHPYFLSIPVRMGCEYATVLVVETNNTGKVDDDPHVHTQRAREAITGMSLGPYVARELGLPVLVPAFPRPEASWEIYTHALDRDTMRVTSGSLKRIDEQLLHMIADAQHHLARKGIDVPERVFMTGFSASGTFSNRFAFLHPGALLGVASGAVNGLPMLPLQSLGRHKLNYPLGLSDFKGISGKRFERATWQALPQFIFMGAEDDNDAIEYDDAYSDKERKTVYAAIGRDMQPDRWLEAQRAYREAGSAATFTTYGATGHWTDRRINDDVVNFFRALLRKSPAGTNCAAAASCNSTRAAEFLLGDWIASSERNVTLESWHATGTDTLTGTGEVRAVENNELRSAESLRIARMGDGVFFIAKTGQNEFPVAFRLTECAEGLAVFENPMHDFPRRLEYRADGDDRLIVQVSDGGEQGFGIEFRRQGDQRHQE